MTLQVAGVLLLAIACGAVDAMPTVDHCLDKFSESLKQTIALKKSCAEANMEDCCQVRKEALQYKCLYIY